MDVLLSTRGQIRKLGNARNIFLPARDAPQHRFRCGQIFATAWKITRYAAVDVVRFADKQFIETTQHI